MNKKIHSESWFVIGLIFILFPIAINAATEGCEGTSIDAPAATKNEIQDLCKAAQQAREFLKQCGIEQSTVLNITLQEKPIHLYNLPVLALYDASENQIKITSYETLKKLIIPNSAYDKLPSLELYKSLIVHEVTHAISFQNINKKDRSTIALEYIASVIQVASMDNNSRQILLNAFPYSSPVDLEMFNEFNLYAAPQWFTANAYRHFNEIDNGCEFLQNILKGEVRFLDAFE